MNHYLLTLPIVCLSATASMAQTTVGDALEAQEGDNRYAVTGEKSATGYWKFTPEDDCLATVAPLSSSAGIPTVGTLAPDATGDSEQPIAAMTGANAGNNAAVYPFKAGTTYYISSTNVNEVGFKLSVQHNANISGGMEYDNPAIIAIGETTYIGKPTAASYNYSAYASYTATESAQLVLSSSSYLTAYINGNSYTSSYENGKYELKVGVNEGETYSMTFSLNQPIVLTASLEHPTPGTLDMPFEMAEGENEVPADYGTYYYTFTPTKTGYLDISSEDELIGGDVTIYSNKYNISYNQPSAKSETGSFNVRTEVTYAQGVTYYIVVNKPDGTDEVQHLTLKMEDYKAGEQESNPIVISELPATMTTEAAKGTYYYSVKVPANTTDMLHVAATGNVAEGTSLNIYPEGYSYSGTYGTNDLRLSVNNSYDCNYIIKWTTADDNAVSFNVEFQTVQPGEIITDPIEAKAGENIIASDGDKYYAYTATRTGKLSVELNNPESTVTFPRGENSYDGEYTAIKNGITYSLEAYQGTRYLIKIQNCKADDSFNITEDDFKQGELRDNAIAVEGNEFVVGDGQNNVWIKYTATKDCQVTVDFDNPEGDAESDNRVQVEFGKSNESMSGMVSTVMNGSTSVNKYHGTKVVNAGESVLVHINASINVEGWTVKFAEGELPEGLSADKPYTIGAGETLNLAERSTFWVKAEVKPGETTFKTFKAVPRTFIYTSLEDAKADNGGNIVEYKCEYDSDYNSIGTYVYNNTTADVQTIYFKLMDSYNDYTFTYVGGETCINGIEAENATGTEVFTLNGVKVANSTNGLEKGVYVVRQNGNAKKIIIK